MKAAQENDLQSVENMVSGGQCDINYQDKVSHEKLVDGNIRERGWWIKIILKMVYNDVDYCSWEIQRLSVLQRITMMPW